MKTCFNLFPPVNKLIALLVCILLILAYTKSKAQNKIKKYNTTDISFTQISNDHLNSQTNTLLQK